jgi:hypothetical protein
MTRGEEVLYNEVFWLPAGSEVILTAWRKPSSKDLELVDLVE